MFIDGCNPEEDGQGVELGIDHVNDKEGDVPKATEVA
jgi:hypothetical protein